jgi:hypothetical protein
MRIFCHFYAKRIPTPRNVFLPTILWIRDFNSWGRPATQSRGHFRHFVVSEHFLNNGIASSFLKFCVLILEHVPQQKIIFWSQFGRPQPDDECSSGHPLLVSSFFWAQFGRPHPDDECSSAAAGTLFWSQFGRPQPDDESSKKLLFQKFFGGCRRGIISGPATFCGK